MGPPRGRGYIVIDGKRNVLAGERMTIGRSRECELVVDDPNVSRRHAEVRRAGDSYVLVDLDSTNGVEVNGKRVKRLDLSDGSRFTIGSTEIVFSEDVT
jgi:pSer/pThr/pTyr-binding forkhead associated (FHA) protein